MGFIGIAYLAPASQLLTKSGIAARVSDAGARAWRPRTGAARAVDGVPARLPADAVFAVTGRFDRTQCAALDAELRSLSARGCDVTLDLSGASHLDGSGVGAIGFLYRRLKARGLRLAVAGAAGQPRALLVQLGLAALLRDGPCPRR